MFCKHSSSSPHDWFNKELRANSRTVEESQDFQVEIGTLEKNQAGRSAIQTQRTYGDRIRGSGEHGKMCY